MSNFSLADWIQIGAMLLMFLGVVAVWTTRRLIERDGMRRAIQFLSVILVIPTILILALQQILKAETVGTLIGALIGYLLSGISAEIPRQRSGTSSAADNTGQSTAAGRTAPAPPP